MIDFKGENIKVQELPSSWMRPEVIVQNFLIWKERLTHSALPPVFTYAILLKIY